MPIKRHKAPSGNRMTSWASSRSEASTRPPSPASRGSAYSRVAPRRSKLHSDAPPPIRAASGPTSRTRPEQVSATPKDSVEGVPPPENETKIGARSFFHFLSNRTASSREQIIVASVAAHFGASAAQQIARDLGWSEPARDLLNTVTQHGEQSCRNVQESEPDTA